MMKRRLASLGLAWALAHAQAASTTAPVAVTDDAGRSVRLASPARRIVSLAPHATELLYAAGAGPQVVATVRYADYPEAARNLPRVGDANQLDLERIAALKPDLVVVWGHGSSVEQVERLKALKLPLFYSEPRNLPDIAASLRTLGHLAGTDETAEASARAYEAEVQRLRQRYAGQAPMRVYFQVWHQPLMTVNDRHLISDVIHLCGGVNVFGSQSALVPMPSAEAVLAARPQVLVTPAGEATPDGHITDSLAEWRGFKTFEPIARHQTVLLPSDHISRATPRVLLAADQLCRALEGFRQAKPKGP